MITGLCIFLVIFHVITAGFVTIPAFLQRAIHLTLVLVITFYLYPFRPKKNGDLSIWSWSFFLLSLGAGLYVVIFNNEIMFSQGMVTLEMAIMGWIIILLVLEQARRSTGLVLAIIATMAVLYPFLGKYLPGLIGHRGYGFARIASTMALSMEGIFGTPLGVSAEYIVLFIFLAATLNQCGMGKYLLKLALAVTGRMVGGPAKTAVIASGFFGTVSGSAVANVVGTGTFTIPMMIKQGFPPHIAGAVETVASTGGQIMPPIMGAAAFIMAQILGISYVEVMAAALIPALLYYTSVFMSIHFHALRLRIRPLPPEQVPSLRQTLQEGWHYLIPLLVLIALLVVIRYTVTLAVLWAIATTFLVTALHKESRITWRKFQEACLDTGKNVLTVAGACAAAGLVVGSINLTGIGFKMFSLIMSITGGKLILVLLFSMLGSTVMGMGVPTTAAYIVVAVTCAPVLIDFKINPIAAHMFVFYFAILSAITPPVALAAYAAAGIAGGSPMKIGWTAVGLGLSTFFVPFIFVYNPELLGIGSIINILLASGTAVLGVSMISASTIGYLLRPLLFLERILLMGGGLTLIIPGLLTDLIGLTLFILVLLRNFWGSKGKDQ